MGISIRTEHLGRYRDVAKLMVKYGYYDLVRTMGLDHVLDKAETVVERAALQGEQLARELEAMGPTFIKLGQTLSTRPDILPPEYIKALDRLQDKVEGFPFDQVEATIEEELGIGLERAYLSFDAVPIAAASIGQVHRAVMPDGRVVAVKVRRPGIEERVKGDLELLTEVADFLESYTQMGQAYRIGEIMDEFRGTIMQELDYGREKSNMLALAENLKEFDRILIPGVVETHCARRVLTMDFIAGKKITSINDEDRTGCDTSALLDEAFQAYLKQVLIDGFFHADPHPGNVILTPDGKIAILDLGMMGRVSQGLRGKLIRLLLAIGEGEPDDAADIAASMGEKTDRFDAREYHRLATQLIVRYQHAPLGELQMGELLMKFSGIIRECGIHPPRELTLLGKTLLNLDQVARTLDPHFDPTASVQKYAAEIMYRHIRRGISTGSVIRGVLELKDVVEHLPKTANAVLDRLARNDLEIRVDAIDQTKLVDGFQKIANRITIGILLAALIIGAGLLAGVPTSYTLLGYPAPAILFFFLAAGGAVALMLDILINDERRRRGG